MTSPTPRRLTYAYVSRETRVGKRYFKCPRCVARKSSGGAGDGVQAGDRWFRCVRTRHTGVCGCGPNPM